MKVKKLGTIVVVTLILASLIAASCSKRTLPHPKYRGLAPRGPHK